MICFSFVFSFEILSFFGEKRRQMAENRCGEVEWW